MKTTTLAEHAEEWFKEQGFKVPPKGTPEYKEMYRRWHQFAFENLQKEEEDAERWDGMS